MTLTAPQQRTTEPPVSNRNPGAGTVACQPGPDLVGVSIGSYVIEGILGEGGMGQVFLARDEKLQRHVAMKRIRKQQGIDPKSHERFRREALAVARLSHPAIVQVFDLLETSAGDWLVMEWVEGRNLAEFIASSELDLRRKLRLAFEISEGLAEAHGKGLIHRDLKPENVLVTLAGHAKIVDFGLARRFMRSDQEESAAGLTRAGTVVGTARFMSPEQASGLELDHRSDLFSFGSLLYEMLSGYPAFPGENWLDILQKVISAKPEPLKAYCRDLPPALLELVDRLLKKNVEARPANAAQVAEKLEQILLTVPEDVETEGRRGPSPNSIALANQSTAGYLPHDSGLRPEPVVRALLRVVRLESRESSLKWDENTRFETTTRELRRLRELVVKHDGLEMEKGDAYLALFERPTDALSCALDYQDALRELSTTLGQQCQSGAAVHLGEVLLRRNTPLEIGRGAKPLEVEGFAKELVAKLSLLLAPGQILLTRGVFDLARRLSGGQQAEQTKEAREQELRWLAHGPYLFEGADEKLEVFEVGRVGYSPLMPPKNSSAARRLLSPSEEKMLGWRPAKDQQIPLRPLWSLIQRVGEGGFGEVWLAQHKTGELRVFKFCFEGERLRALKREVTLFRLIKEALGHRTDIARILDWQFEEAPYFVESEYTEGGNLVDWVERQGGLTRVPLSTRLDLAAGVADALAAAHSVGVLHKDVKPENVLIAIGPDGSPKACLTDFGIGQLTQRERLESAGFTAIGFTHTLDPADSGAGTVGYLAPELLEGKTATIQADIYSLGVLVYQLVAGDLKHTLAPGWERYIDNSLLAEDIALFVDGEPGRRPASAQEVAIRLRTLEQRRARVEAERKAIEDAEKSRLALERAVQRRKVFGRIVVAATVVLTIVSLLAFQAVRSGHEAERLRQISESRRLQAESLIGFMLGDLQNKLEPLGKLEILEDMGDQAMKYFAAVSTTELSTEEIFQHSKAMSNIGYLRFKQGDLDSSLAAYQNSLALANGLAQRDPANAEWQLNLATNHFQIGRILWQKGDFPLALERFEAQLSIAHSMFTKRPDDPDLQIQLANSRNNIGFVRQAQGDREGAATDFRFALSMTQEIVKRKPNDPNLKYELANRAMALGGILWESGKTGESFRNFELGHSILKSLLKDDESNTLWIEKLMVCQSFLGRILQAAGDLDGARRHAESNLTFGKQLVAIEPRQMTWQRELAFAYSQLSRNLLARGRYREAYNHAAHELEVLSNSETELADHAQSLELATAHIDLGRALLGLGDLKKAHTQASAAIKSLQPRKDGKVRDVNRHKGSALILLGLAEESPSQANTAWENAAEVLEPAVEESPTIETLLLWAQALKLLQRTTEVKEVEDKIDQAREQIFRNFAVSEKSE